MSNDDMKLEVPFDMDGSLDDIETLPGFVTPLSGAYRLICEEWSNKIVAKKPSAEFKFKIVQVLELSEQPDLGDAPPKEGDMFSQLFFLDNKVAIDRMKAFLTPVAVKLGISTSEKGGVRKCADAMKNAFMGAIIIRSQDKDNRMKYHAKIKSVILE